MGQLSVREAHFIERNSARRRVVHVDPVPRKSEFREACHLLGPELPALGKAEIKKNRIPRPDKAYELATFLSQAQHLFSTGLVVDRKGRVLAQTRVEDR